MSPRDVFLISPRRFGILTQTGFLVTSGTPVSPSGQTGQAQIMTLTCNETSSAVSCEATCFGLPWTVPVLALTVLHPRKTFSPRKTGTTGQPKNPPTWKKKKNAYKQRSTACWHKQFFFSFVSIHSAFSQIYQNAKVIMSPLYHSLKIFIEVLEPAFFQPADCLVKHFPAQLLQSSRFSSFQLISSGTSANLSASSSYHGTPD